MASTNVTIDLTNYKDRVGARVPEGTYRAIVDDAEMDTSKAGNPMVNVWFRIHGGEHDGATITDRLTITEKALFRVVGFLQALGYKTPKKRLQLDIGKFIGRSLDITVRDGEPYNGRVKSEVSGYAKVSKAEAASSGSDLADLEDGGDDETEQAEVESATAAPEEETEAPTRVRATSKQNAPEEGAEDAEQGEVDLDDLEDL